MEKSKLVSSAIAKLKIAYPYYFKELPNEEFVGLISMYQEQLADQHSKIVLKAINEIIKTSKFMPTIADILQKCSEVKDTALEKYNNWFLKKMRDDGYFKYGVCGELSLEHQERNFDKAERWLKSGIMPNWFSEDLKRYGYDDEIEKIEGKNELWISM